jgi:hypothetical protein
MKTKLTLLAALCEFSLSAAAPTPRTSGPSSIPTSVEELGINADCTSGGYTYSTARLLAALIFPPNR